MPADHRINCSGEGDLGLRWMNDSAINAGSIAVAKRSRSVSILQSKTERLNITVIQEIQRLLRREQTAL